VPVHVVDTDCDQDSTDAVRSGVSLSVIVLSSVGVEEMETKSETVTTLDSVTSTLSDTVIANDEVRVSDCGCDRLNDAVCSSVRLAVAVVQDVFVIDLLVRVGVMVANTCAVSRSTVHNKIVQERLSCGRCNMTCAAVKSSNHNVGGAVQGDNTRA
jgi:hypothetical protein